MKKHLVLMAVSVVVLAGGCAEKSTSTSSASGAPSGAKPYPLTVCVVSGEKLDSMGDPVVFVHAGQEIKLCCKDCRADFDKEPAKFLAKLAPK